MEIFLFAPAVSPQSQADSYKRMDDGKWVFGLDNLWVLAPTRHGAHNWEGPGKLTAMKALESLSLHTKANSFIESKADGKKVVIAGHSMGGHGACTFSLLGICELDKEGKDCGENESAKKYQQHQEDTVDRNQAGEGVFTLTVYNPASINGVRGVRILQQLIPFRHSSVQIRLSTGAAILRTENVARMSLSEPAISPIDWDQRHITVDDTVVNLEKSSGHSRKSPTFLCRSGSSAWKVCDQKSFESKFERGPLNMGPARRIAESPFLIVTGTTGNPDTVEILRRFAVYIANQFYLTSDTICHVITDKELDQTTADDFNLIVVGRPEHNSWSRQFHEDIPLKFHEKHLSLSDCRFDATRTGAIFLAPHGGTRLALVLTGNSLTGVEDIVNLATPTILPMARSPFSNMIPDFVITGPRFGARGPGGYLCTGFWGNSWEYRRELASCSC
ncbi:hypothetical protein QZH41_015265 [Actinostola sp. cb2023]|nr:hypothetical protein QZH41_015265 [Actinostola sp. cb2023]